MTKEFEQAIAAIAAEYGGTYDGESIWIDKERVVSAVDGERFYGGSWSLKKIPTFRVDPLFTWNWRHELSRLGIRCNPVNYDVDDTGTPKNQQKCLDRIRKVLETYQAAVQERNATKDANANALKVFADRYGCVVSGGRFSRYDSYSSEKCGYCPTQNTSAYLIALDGYTAKAGETRFEDGTLEEFGVTITAKNQADAERIMGVLKGNGIILEAQP